MHPPAEEKSWPAVPYRWLIWHLYLAGWSTALLMPMSGSNDWKVHDISMKFVFAKTLHVAAYAVLAMLSGWLLAPRRYRWLLLVFMALHAPTTEYLQTYVPGRTGHVRDVGLDLIGISIGCLLTWKWWRS
jgi:VanZ family protein